MLVDDEEIFLQSLKDGMDTISDLFETDICYSVDSAIKNIESMQYDLVITDIRMPNKTGLDLLVYLSDINFKGSVMTMSAYHSEQSGKTVAALGGIRLIPKPFEFNWFKNMLLEWLSNSGKEQTVTFESINLLTAIQIISIEKKTSALEINTNGKKGIIYFSNGEVINAEYDGLEGEHAALKLIAVNSGSISIRPIRERVKHTMEIPLVENMMNIIKYIDDISSNQELTGEENTGKNVKEHKKNNPPKNKNKKENKKKELNMSITEMLKPLAEVKGYLGAGVFTPQGELLEGTADISGIHFEQAGSLIHDALSDSRKMCNEIGFGRLDMLQLYTEMGIIFAACHDDGEMHFHTILVIKSDGNIAMSKLKLKKVVAALTSAF
ncbi:MAG: response regulator [bacterium]|nr:response regulator [bacterium]